MTLPEKPKTSLSVGPSVFSQMDTSYVATSVAKNTSGKTTNYAASVDVVMEAIKKKYKEEQNAKKNPIEKNVEVEEEEEEPM